MWNKCRRLLLILLALCLSLHIPSALAAGPDLWEVTPTTVPSSDDSSDDSIRILGHAQRGDIKTIRILSGTAYYPISVKVYAPEHPTTVVEVLVKKNNQVKAGDPLVRVQGNTDPVELAQAQLDLRRAEDSMLQGLASREDALAQLRLQLTTEADSFAREILSLTIEKQELSLTQYRTQQEESVARLRLQVTELEHQSSVKTICAPADGKISQLLSLKVGKELAGGQELLTISDESVVLYRMSAQNDQLFYGSSVSVFSSSNDTNRLPGQVVGTPGILPKTADAQIAYVALFPQEVAMKTPSSIRVETAVVDYQNVLLVPGSAIYEDDTNNNYRYSYVITYRDGVKKKCPIKTLYHTGREHTITDDTQYWVIWGVNEGDVLVAE